MDSNLFEYLIIIFFIVSALQSLFGKKKKEQKKRQQQQRREMPSSGQARRRTQNTRRKEESPRDIFEEMFGVKLPKEEEKETKIPADKDTEVLDPSSANQTTWNPEEEYKDSIGVETVRYEDNKEEKPSYQEEMAALERKADRMKKSLDSLPDQIEVVDISSVSEEQKILASRIKRTLRDPDSLREYILVSELLNKPKALRR